MQGMFVASKVLLLLVQLAYDQTEYAPTRKRFFKPRSSCRLLRGMAILDLLLSPHWLSLF